MQKIRSVDDIDKLSKEQYYMCFIEEHFMICLKILKASEVLIHFRNKEIVVINKEFATVDDVLNWINKYEQKDNNAEVALSEMIADINTDQYKCMPIEYRIEILASWMKMNYGEII